MNPPRTILNGDLRRLLGVTFFGRGETYYKDGLVLDHREVRFKDNFAVIVGRVAGKGVTPYVQKISLYWDDANVLDDIVADCSCPVRFNCKHVVAVCLAYRTALRRGKATKPDDSNFDWLEKVQRSGQDKLESKDQRDSVVYLLDKVLGDGVVGVQVAYSRHLKNGSMGVPRKANLDNLAHPYFRPAYAKEDDSDIVRLLLASDSDDWREYRRLSGSVGALALEKMVATGQCYWQSVKSKPLKSGSSRPIDIYWQEAQSTHLKLILSAGSNSHLIYTEPMLYVALNESEIGEVEAMGLNAAQLQQLSASPELPLEQAQSFSQVLVERYSDLGIPPPRKIETTYLQDVAPVPTIELDQVVIDGVSVRVIRPQFRYSEWTLSPANGSLKTLVQNGDKLVEISRDGAEEVAYLNELVEMGFASLNVPDSQEIVYTTPGKQDEQASISAWAEFISERTPELESRGWHVKRNDAFALDFYQADQYWGEIEEHSHDWFDLRLDIEINGQRMSLLQLLLPILDQFEPDQLPETIYIPLDEVQYVPVSAEEIRPYLQTLYELYDFIQPGEDHLRLSRYDATLLTELDTGTDLIWQGGTFLRALGEKLQNFKGIDVCPIPEGFSGELRNYQQAGLDWLAFLREYGLNGILADDMGLGKTVQTIAHIQNEKVSDRLDGPVLVVAPTSLMGNWRRELAAFAVDLKVLILQGPERHKNFKLIPEVDVVLTTYPLLPRDQDVLLEIEYPMVVLDEAQVIKNPRAKAALVVRKLKARHRICLTGTPMENHLGELWAQFDFLMPGFLGSYRTFKKIYQNPIEKHGDRDRQEKLSRRIAPFMLRRKKDEVEKELPPKTEIIRSIPLGKAQAALYETIRLSMEARVRETIASKGLARSHITVLDALLKLRQTCCDPRLLKLEQAKKVQESAKLEMLMEMLPELLEEGRRILLFSQFVTMLELIETTLDEANIGTVKLTGKTRNRDEVIQQFDDGVADVFLISLKAGGVGLNLTSADTVILYDPWWNPAVESQAMDRAHRIGQDKPVFVYKLLTERTVEEKILALQEQKKALAEGVYNGANGGATSGKGGLSNADIQVLFEPLA